MMILLGGVARLICQKLDDCIFRGANGVGQYATRSGNGSNFSGTNEEAMLDGLVWRVFCASAS